ncbi:hypothetical protein CIB84_008460, partial [Bambusicola thoracicus]
TSVQSSALSRGAQLLFQPSTERGSAPGTAQRCLAAERKMQASRMPKRAALLSLRALSSWCAAVAHRLHRWGFHQAVLREIKIISSRKELYQKKLQY